MAGVLSSVKQQCHSSSPHRPTGIVSSARHLNFQPRRLQQRDRVHVSTQQHQNVAQQSPVGCAAASISAGEVATTSGRTAEQYFESDKRPVILYDGVCNMCNGFVNLMLDIDTAGAFRLSALQSEAGKKLLARSGRDPNDISSIVLVEASGQHYIRSDAVLNISSKLGIPLRLISMLGFPVPRFIRDSAYDVVANNRYSVLGKTTACRLMEPKHAARFLVE